MSPLRQQMLAALQLSGKGERTQEAYVREVRLLAQFYHKSPDRLSEQELQRYFLHRKNVDGLAPTSMRICYSGIRFFYQHVLKRDWHTLALLRAQTTHRLPAVLSVEEVRRLLKAATPLPNQVYFSTVYSLGLRLHEALFLQVSDIDGQRLQVHVHRGKGAKDRYVPLPVDTLTLLRTYWKTHRHPTWLFPATGRDHIRVWNARLCTLIDRYHARKDDAGRLARRLQREMASLWVLLYEHGVETTNNRAERALRFGVLWRKGSHGSASDKGNRWVERTLSLRQTCRQLGQSTFGVLVDAVTSLFCGRQPDLSWLY